VLLEVGADSISRRLPVVRLLPAIILFPLFGSACATAKPNDGAPAERIVTVRDPALERRIAELELRLLEREAQVEELQARLEDTRGEVVRTMGKVQTVASRAEAASGMAEAEVALQSLKATAGQHAPEVAQATALVRQSSAEFNKQNYGGALYLAGQAKALAGGARGRMGSGTSSASRTGETSFAVPLRLKATGRGNVRQGPGTTFSVVFSLEAGALLTGHSYVGDRVRVTDDSGPSGWIFR
jgi:TolA-binding protein